MKIVLLATAALFFAAAQAAPCDVDPLLTANKATAISALDGIFNKRDPTAVDKYIGSTYLQHNPTVGDGPAGLKALIPYLSPDSKTVYGAQAAEGDLVWTHSRSGSASNASASASIIVDVFRVKDGKLVEHWDIIQTEVPASQTVSGRPMFPIVADSLLPVTTGCGDASAVPCVSKATLSANKVLAATALDAFFNKHDVSAVDKYIAKTYLQHNPTAEDGPEGLKTLIGSLPPSLTFELGAQAADEDLVWTQGRYGGIPGQNATIIIDIFRVQDGKIVEHWDIAQVETPANLTVSGRPMFPITP
ncbi:hypothetical protein Gpo141_00014351 [Globisporangium polare]